MKRRALAVVGAAVLAAGLSAGCSSTKSNATPGGASNPGGGSSNGDSGRAGGGGGQATTPDPCSLVTVDEAASALGETASKLTKDTHQNEANGVITLVCDYSDDSGGAVEISVAPGPFDQKEVATVQAAYSKSSLVSIGDGGVAFGLGSGNRAVEFWAHGFKVQTGVNSFSGTGPDPATSAATLANAALARLP
jgi:hypothetical protein